MTQVEQTPNARTFMHAKVHTVKPDATLVDVIQQLLKHKVSNVPVVDEQGGKAVLVGFISEADCLEHLSNELFYGSPSPQLTAELIMKRHPVCVEPDANIFTMASIFTNHRLRHLPVVEDGHLLGIVSRRDVLKAMEEYYRKVVHHREEEKNPPDLSKIINQRFIMRGM